MTAIRNHIYHRLPRAFRSIIPALFLVLNYGVLIAQVKHTVQVKAVDQRLQVIPNVSISVNGNDFISTGSRGVVFMEFSDSELPPASVKFSSDELEVESWNYSRGVLEIIARKKIYDKVSVLVRDASGNRLNNVSVTFLGKNIFKGSTNERGMVELVLQKGENISGKEQFSINGYTVTDYVAGDPNTIVATPVKQEPANQKSTRPNPVIDEKYFKTFDLDQLDSIQSLTVFYAVFKNYNIENLDPVMKRRIDTKFNELMFKLQDSIRDQQKNYIAHISDSSRVNDDVSNVLNQAIAEGEMLDEFQRDFDEKIQLISNKLSEGVENLSNLEQQELISNIDKIGIILAQNERKFYRNLSSYRAILNSLKEKLLHIQDLEEKLSISEAQRIEDQKVFRRRMLVIFFITIVFGIMIIMLIYFSNKLKKQQDALINANEEIKSINENLENLVTQRTALLENAINEMDTFFYRASHDLRRPICSIIGLANIAKYTADKSSLELFDKASESAQEMDRMLRKLQVINEIHHPQDFSTIMVAAEVERARLNFSEFISRNNVNFQIDCPHDLSFNTFPRLIETILFNLIENALFYSVLNKPVAPEVKVTAERKGDQLELNIFDNGIGIDPSIHTRVWTMFFVGDERSQGNGLGLYVVRKAVEALGGQIRFESERYAYTKFFILLPLK